MALSNSFRSNQGQRPSADYVWRRGLPGAGRRRGGVGPGTVDGDGGVTYSYISTALLVKCHLGRET